MTRDTVNVLSIPRAGNTARKLVGNILNVLMMDQVGFSQVHCPCPYSVFTISWVRKLVFVPSDTKVTISTRELLAVSPDVCRHVKDIVTMKKVSANLLEVTDSDIPSSLSGISLPDSHSPAVYVDLVKYDKGLAAATALLLRVIYPNFGRGVKPECILDGGAQVVVMRSDIWERLRVPISQSMATSMGSANASRTMTRGLVENHPVQLGSITVCLQIQVVDGAPFEVLLGRPFFDVTSCSEISRPGGHHEIHVKDPSTGKPYVFPTQP